MSQTVSPSTSRYYGLARVSRAWRVSRAGVYRFLKGTPSPAIARRPGPTGPCPDADLADLIRREIEASDFHGEGYRKIWARLRVAGVRSSPRRVRRVMGENGLLAPHRVGRNQEKTHDGTIVTDKVNEMWGTDMSQTVTLEEGRAYVFVAVEHANSEIIGIHAARSARCGRSKPSRNCAPSSSHSPGATMKLGSSRGMDTKRPRGSERSKPRHELQLTRPSQPPYPWPPEQAQPGVSKPCRTTKSTVYEGSTRLGGRCYTIHSFPNPPEPARRLDTLLRLLSRPQNSIFGAGIFPLE